jgi:hypothetical protein
MKFLFTLLLVALAIVAAAYFTAEIALDQATSAFLKFISIDYPAGRYRAIVSVLNGLVEMRPYGKDDKGIPEAFLLGTGDVKSVEGVIKSVFPGVEVMNASFKHVDYKPPAEITWTGLSFDLKITNKRIARFANFLSISVDRVSLVPEDIKERIVLVTMTGIKTDLQGAAQGVPAKLRHREIPEFVARMKFRSFDPQEMLKEVKELLKDLAASAE